MRKQHSSLLARDTHSRMDGSSLELSKVAGRWDLHNKGKKHSGEFAASPEKASSGSEVHINKWRSGFCCTSGLLSHENGHE